MEKFSYRSVMAVPRLKKVVVNTGFGKQVSGKGSDEQKKIYTPILEDLSLICGQKAILANAKKSISTFKTRTGMPIGAKVTLRGKKMYDFLERLINIALPRSRDFRGLEPASVDKKGNLSIGIKEHIIFPEVSPEKTKLIFGFEVSVATNAETKEEGLELFKMLGFPIKA
jgi:large subunit ribosomal protein L5